MAYGYGGDDDLQVAGSITLPVWLYGGDGNDAEGRQRRQRPGRRRRRRSPGRGQRPRPDHRRDGADRMIGNGGDDILIGGTTSYDGNEAALVAIMAEWTSGHDFATRAPT